MSFKATAKQVIKELEISDPYSPQRHSLFDDTAKLSERDQIKVVKKLIDLRRNGLFDISFKDFCRNIEITSQKAIDMIFEYVIEINLSYYEWLKYVQHNVSIKLVEKLLDEIPRDDIYDILEESPNKDLALQKLCIDSTVRKTRGFPDHHLKNFSEKQIKKYILKKYPEYAFHFVGVFSDYDFVKASWETAESKSDICDSMSFIKNPSLEVQKLFLSKCPDGFEFIKKPDTDIFKQALKTKPYLIFSYENIEIEHEVKMNAMLNMISAMGVSQDHIDSCKGDDIKSLNAKMDLLIELFLKTMIRPF